MRTGIDMVVETRSARGPGRPRPLPAARRRHRDGRRRHRLRARAARKSAAFPYMRAAHDSAMSIPGHIDPVPVPRPARRARTRASTWSACPRRRSATALAEAGLDERQAKLRAKQLWHQIYNRGATDFARDERHRQAAARLARRAVRDRAGPRWSIEQVSTDGTRKWLLRTHDGHDFEMVFIPDADRGTLCVSSQVGCTLNCRFCHTGTMRLVRNLDCRRDRRPGHARPRCARRMAVPARGPDALQHRDDGDGRAALQFRQCPRRAEDRHGRRRARPVAAADHAFDLGRGADDGARRRGDRRQPRRLAPRGRPRRCATRSCR